MTYESRFSEGGGTPWIFGAGVPHGFLNLGPYYVLLHTRFIVYFMQRPLSSRIDFFFHLSSQSSVMIVRQHLLI